MSKRRAIIVVEFEGGSPRAIATINDHMAQTAEDIRRSVLPACGVYVATSVGAVCDTIPRYSDRNITVEDLNNVTFRGIGTKHKKEQ
tara:strand:- start:509 stop:769 length:261 start_codon:yes stop_codon:yes gene_type:complete